MWKRKSGEQIDLASGNVPYYIGTQDGKTRCRISDFLLKFYPGVIMKCDEKKKRQRRREAIKEEETSCNDV